MTPSFRKSALLILILAFALSCRPISKDYLAHQWLGDDGKQIMQFDGDSTLLWVFHEEVLSDTFLIHYKLDETPDPDQLDLYDFTAGILKGKVLAGIVELHSGDSILLDFEPTDNLAEADSVRPKEFNPEQKRYFVRKK